VRLGTPRWPLRDSRPILAAAEHTADLTVIATSCSARGPGRVLAGELDVASRLPEPIGGVRRGSWRASRSLWFRQAPSPRRRGRFRSSVSRARRCSCPARTRTRLLRPRRRCLHSTDSSRDPGVHRPAAQAWSPACGPRVEVGIRRPRLVPHRAADPDLVRGRSPAGDGRRVVDSLAGAHPAGGDGCFLEARAAAPRKRLVDASAMTASAAQGRVDVSV